MRTLFLLVSIISLASATIRGADERGVPRDLKGSKEGMGMTMGGKSSTPKSPTAPLVSTVDRSEPIGPVVNIVSISPFSAVTPAPVADASSVPVAAAAEFKGTEIPTPSPVKATLAHPTVEPVAVVTSLPVSAVTSAPVADASLTPVAAAAEFEGTEIPTPSPVKATLAHPTIEPVEEPIPSPVIGRMCPTSTSLAFQSEPGAVSCTSNADCSALEESAFGPACCTYPYCVCAVRFLNDEKEFLCLSQ